VTDRPILFSGPMVCALDDGRKTQTRRLGSSPLAKVKPGDRLWVRERTMVEAIVPLIDGEGLLLRYDADGSGTSAIPIPERLNRGAISVGRRLSMGCFREASRLTLIVEEVRFQRLQDISEADAIAEGIETGRHPDTDEVCGWRDYETIHTGRHEGVNHPHAIVPYTEAWRSYSSLWDELHRAEGERWQHNPEIVALTFRVIHENIDRIEA